MENRDIRTFIKVVEMNNFTKAAAELGYSQTAVSAQIKRLEEELGKPLFDRVGKSIQLTAAGKLFLPYAHKMLRLEAEAINCLLEDDAISGELTIGTSSSLSSKFVPNVLKPLIADYPGIKPAVKIIDDGAELYRRMKLGEIDFGVVISDGNNDVKDVVVLGKSRFKMIFVGSPDNPLAKRDMVSLEEFLKQPVIISDREGDYTEFLIRTAVNQGLEVNPIMEIGSVTAIVDFVMEGAGVAFVPLYMVKDRLERGELAHITLDFPQTGLLIELICNRERWMNPQMRKFRDYMVDYFDNMTI